MEKVIIKALNSANLRIDNSVDTDREYDIAANVNIESNNVVNNIDSGSVMKNGMDVASFSSSSNENLWIDFRSVDASEQCAVITAVNSFIASIRTKATGENMLSNINSI